MAKEAANPTKADSTPAMKAEAEKSDIKERELAMETSYPGSEVSRTVVRIITRRAPEKSLMG